MSVTKKATTLEEVALDDASKPRLYYYASGILCSPSKDIVSYHPKNIHYYGSAESFFRDKRVDLEKLSQIFVEKPEIFYSLKRGLRTRQTRASFYDHLGRCPYDADDAWFALARLLQANICFSPPKAVNRKEEIACIYQPNGWKITI